MATSNQLEVSVEQSSGLERRMTVRVPTADIEKEVDARLRKVGKTARLKGFRPGKVPPKVVRRQYGGQVRQEVVSDLIRSSYSRAISEQNLNPAGGPSIEPVTGQGDEHFSYCAVFEVYPEFELGSIEGLEVEVSEVSVEDADVDEMIEKLRAQRAEWQAVDRKAKDGDRVVVDFVGTVDKQPFEGGEGKEIAVTVGAGQVIEDFDKALKGLAAGDHKSAKVRFPKDYPAEELAAKKAVFEIDVHRVEEQVLPEVDDAFIESFGVEEGGIDALKADVRKNMQRELDERLRAERKNATLDALLKANPIDIPRTLVDEEIGNLQAEAMRRMGVDDPAKAPAPEQFRSAAEQRVALGLLVQEVVRKHQIELERERVDARVDELSSAYEQPEEVARMYRANRELLAQIESTVLEDQIVDFLFEHAVTKTKARSFADFVGV